MSTNKAEERNTPAQHAQQHDPTNGEATHHDHAPAQQSVELLPCDGHVESNRTTLIKAENDEFTAATIDGTATLRPDPLPSKKRRESEAALHTPEPTTQANKKRKRGPSPPWHFPTTETTTLKTADGRRISARVNVGTPGLSESESRGRSASHPDPPARSRPTSPPWKQFGAEGPTSINVDGKRKSGRVNKELIGGPKRVSPRTKKLQDLRALEENAEAKATPSKSTSGSSKKIDREARHQKKSPDGGLERTSTSDVSANRIAELQAQIAALQPTRSFPTPIKSIETAPPKASQLKAHQHATKQEESASTPSHKKAPRPGSVFHSSEGRSKASPKIKLKINAPRRTVPPPHPQAQIPSTVLPPRLSLPQVIETFELKEMQLPHMENDRGPPDADYFALRAEKQSIEEAAMRKKLLRATEPGGALSKGVLSLFRDDQQPEAPAQYGHHDHLVAHAAFLRQLQLREKASHRLLAKKTAYECLEKWKAKNGPTEEDLLAEHKRMIDLVRKQVVVDMQTKWSMVEAHVQEIKKRAWEVEQEQIRAQKLQKKLEYSENLLARQRGDADSDTDMDASRTGDVDESDGDDEADLEENMSESESGSGSEKVEDGGEMDEDTLAAYLAQRETEQPAGRSNEEHQKGDGLADTTPSARNSQTRGVRVVDEGDTDEKADTEDAPTTETDEPQRRTRTRGRESNSASPTREEMDIDKHLSSDESVDMDSEEYDSDEDLSSTGDEDEQEVESHEGGGTRGESKAAVVRNSLLALYSEKELLDERGGSLPTPMTSVENGGDNDNPRPQSEDRAESQAAGGAQVDQDKITNEHNELDESPKPLRPQESTPAAEDVDVLAQQQQIDERFRGLEDAVVSELNEDSHGVKDMIPQPALLRGQLRSYQHAGLDWLASLYRNGTNGILADEMGLGKTIQTISLLAHLAEVHEVWDPHLVIVPSSVVLNWVAEFQKFLPGFRVLAYYGSAEDRAHKRKGWTNDPHHEVREKRGYNVVVTSYNVAMADINAIRNVQWHYLVLDEAHNIRNFNSQRWQVLIRLRTRARLLLTGTPLQNDLAEVWSLLTFLTAGDDDRSHGELEEFLGHWKDPVKEIFDQGVEKISENAQRVVDQLHVSLRPFLLRRKKSEVEKDLPKKTESVVVCKLSKRQRQLYQDYMGLAETKATLAKGSGVQAGAVLLSLRRVCNHPDLFDPRPIQTSFAMEHSPLEAFSNRERLIRRLLGAVDEIPQDLCLIGKEPLKRSTTRRSRHLAATSILREQLEELAVSVAGSIPNPATIAGSRALQRLHRRERKLRQLRAYIQVTENGLKSAPVYGSDLRELVTIQNTSRYVYSERGQSLAKELRAWLPIMHRPHILAHASDWQLLKSSCLQQNIATHHSYAQRLQDTIIRFAFVPPSAVVPILDYAIPPELQAVIRAAPDYPREVDFGHEARMRTSIAFPDKRLLIYDSGKLQRLTYLLRELQAKGSRSLIFTQMTGTLNVLEQFLSLMNLPYLRLDGSTPLERRQLYSSEFNRPDSKYQCMILSSRAGGVGLNLTGASSVIFYDLDWNPQMDRQCMDRAHRIGQMRDVEVFKMVSEKTVEENILRRANQKSLLDQTVIQDGHFTTGYQQKRLQEGSQGEEADEVSLAIDRLTAQTLASVEDKEDVQAAQQAAKEDRQDDIDFAERPSKGTSKANTPGPGTAEADEVEEVWQGHVDLYMIKFMEHHLRNWVYVPAPVRKLDKHGRDPSHRPKRKR